MFFSWQKNKKEEEILYKKNNNDLIKELKEKGIARKGYKIFNKEDHHIGEVTSGSISPFLMKSIGMGYINYEEKNIYKSIYIEVRNKKIEAEISKRPFI
jgi:aminomethyltransferase